MKTTQIAKTLLVGIMFCTMYSAGYSQEKNKSDDAQKFEVKKIEAQKAVVVKCSVPSSQISAKIGEAYGKIFALLGQKQIQPSGSPFAVYLEYDPAGNTVFEAGVPVSAAVETTGDIIYKEYPAMTVVSSLHKGAYDKVSAVYDAMAKYMKDKGLQPANIAWELYINDPSQVANPSENQTIIYMLVK